MTAVITPSTSTNLKNLYKGQADTSDWKCYKRDGKMVEFSVEKIKGALGRCFKAIELNCEIGDGQTASLIDNLARKTVNTLAAGGLTSPTVEDVQRAVLQQLWSEGLFAAAEHYGNYREERRRQREERPIDPEEAARIEADAKYFPTQLQAYQFYSKFSRWREDAGRRETWVECNDRVFNWFGLLPAFSKLSPGEVGWLRHMMLNLKASPAMRVVQMAGPALDRCNIGVYNCAYHPIIDLRAFSELLYILMQGSGNGFSVEGEYVNKLPKVNKQRKGIAPSKYIINDNTEAWCDALDLGLKEWYAGRDVEFDYSLIRPKGSKLKTKGGRASGPEPLKELLDYVRDMILKAQGRKLTDLEVHDICCKIGRIVQVGGVRRAACISLSDLNSVAMRDCKHGEWWKVAKHRSMANNSAVYDYNGLPPVDVFMEEWLALIKSHSGERGLFNRAAARLCKPKRRKMAKFGGNPCLEILLRPFGLCNLSISVIRGDETEDEIIDKVKAATYFGVLQSTATNFNYVRPEWKKNAEEERLLGVDVMGHLDHHLLRPGAAGRDKLVTRMKEAVAETALMLSARFGINYSAANTCLKPGGDSGVFFDSCTLGGYPAEYQIRRVREPMVSPVTALLRNQGVPFNVDPVNPELAVFDFPKKNPENCITHESMSAIEQLDNWLFWKTTWAEHSCSVTINVKDHEWPEVGAWVYKPEHFKHLTGISFLPFDGGSYQLTPNEKIDRVRYEKLAAEFPKIDWAKLIRYETDDMTTGSQTAACVGNSCE